MLSDFRFVFVAVDGSSAENVNPKSAQEDREFIKSYVIPISQLPQRLQPVASLVADGL